jgi:hypothetical protein
MLQPWLDARGLGDATQVLIYFAVAKQGEMPTDGKTDMNPEARAARRGAAAAGAAAARAVAYADKNTQPLCVGFRRG